MPRKIDETHMLGIFAREPAVMRWLAKQREMAAAAILVATDLDKEHDAVINYRCWDTIFQRFENARKKVEDGPNEKDLS